MDLKYLLDDQSVTFAAYTTATGAPVTVDKDTAGLALWYRCGVTGLKIPLTLLTTPAVNNLATLDAAHADAGILVIQGAEHRFDLPDAATHTAGALTVSWGGSATGITIDGGTANLIGQANTATDVSQAAGRTVGDVGAGNTAHLLQAADSGATAVARPRDVHGRRVLYVDTSVVSSGTGLTAATAFKTFEEAVAVLDHYDEIRVMGGTYTLHATSTINKNYVTIRGIGWGSHITSDTDVTNTIAVNANGVHFIDIAVSNAKTPVAMGDKAISFVAGSTDAFFTRCKITGLADAVVTEALYGRMVAEDCVFIGPEYAFEAMTADLEDEASYCLRRCLFTSVGWSTCIANGIFIQSHKVEIEDCDVYVSKLTDTYTPTQTTQGILLQKNTALPASARITNTRVYVNYQVAAGPAPTGIESNMSTRLDGVFVTVSSAAASPMDLRAVDGAVISVDSATVYDTTKTAGTVTLVAEQTGTKIATMQADYLRRSTSADIPNLTAAQLAGVFSVDMADVEDAAPQDSLCAIILGALHWSLSGTTLTIKKTDATTFDTITVSTDTDADRIVGAG